jgi:hypothetical protein
MTAPSCVCWRHIPVPLLCALLEADKKREVLLHLSREKKIEIQERIYNQHVRLLSSEPFGGLRFQSLLGPGSRHCYGIITLTGRNPQSNHRIKLDASFARNSYLPAPAAAESSASACCLEGRLGIGWRRIIAAIESLSRKIRTTIPIRNATAIAKRVQR